MVEMSSKRIGYHHAGLDAKDRSLVETLFLEGKILALCCTTTLAVGVCPISNSEADMKGQFACAFSHRQKHSNISPR